VIPTTFDYARATSLDDALAKIQAAGGAAKFIAGGHSLVPLMKLRLSEPQMLVDISRIPDLAGIHERDGKVVIGAGTVHHAVATSPLLQQACPAVADCAAAIGDPQVRNRGTIGGSLAHADPAGDWPAALLALDAVVTIAGGSGRRSLPLRDFIVDAYTTALAQDEILTAIAVPFPRRPSGGAYVKFERRAGDFAVASAGVQLELDEATAAGAWRSAWGRSAQRPSARTTPSAS
jgi:carbon-monoxide dehydrogenase medium subunit